MIFKMLLFYRKAHDGAVLRFFIAFRYNLQTKQFKNQKTAQGKPCAVLLFFSFVFSAHLFYSVVTVIKHLGDIHQTKMANVTQINNFIIK